MPSPGQQRPITVHTFSITNQNHTHAHRPQSAHPHPRRTVRINTKSRVNMQLWHAGRVRAVRTRSSSVRWRCWPTPPQRAKRRRMPRMSTERDHRAKTAAAWWRRREVPPPEATGRWQDDNSPTASVLASDGGFARCSGAY